MKYTVTFNYKVSITKADGAEHSKKNNRMFTKTEPGEITYMDNSVAYGIATQAIMEGMAERVGESDHKEVMIIITQLKWEGQE